MKSLLLKVHWIASSCCMIWSTLSVRRIVSQPVQPSPTSSKSATKGSKSWDSAVAGVEQVTTKRKGEKKGEIPSMKIGPTVFTHVGTTANGIEVCMSKELKDKGSKKRRSLLNANSHEEMPGYHQTASIGTATIPRRVLQYYAPPTSSSTITATTSSPQYSPIELVGIDMPPPKKVSDSPPPPKVALFVPYTATQSTPNTTNNSSPVSPSAPIPPITYSSPYTAPETYTIRYNRSAPISPSYPTATSISSSTPSLAPYTKKKSKKSSINSPTTINTVNQLPAIPTHYHNEVSKPSIGIAASNITTSPTYNVTSTVTLPPPPGLKKDAYYDPLTSVKKSAKKLFPNPQHITIPNATSEDVPCIHATEYETAASSSTSETSVFITEQDVVDVTFSACPDGFPITKPEIKSALTTTHANAGYSSYIDDVLSVGFTSASVTYEIQKNFTAHHNYELVIKTGQVAVDIQHIISSIETLMGGFTVRDVFNCTTLNAHSRRFLYGTKNSTYGTTSHAGSSSSYNRSNSTSNSSAGILISKYSLSPTDVVSLTENCTQLQAEGNLTTCIVVNSSSTVYYSSNLSATTQQNLEESIRQVFVHHCSTGNFSSIGVLKCAALPSPNAIPPKNTVSIKNKTGIPEAKVGSLGMVKSNEPAASINNAQTSTQSQQASNSVLSTVGTLMIVLSAMGILTFLALFALQKRKKVKESNRFCELEEAEIADDVIVEKYGLDVEDKSVFTSASRSQANEMSLVNEIALSKTKSRLMTSVDEGSLSLDGEQILDDLKLTEDNPVVFKHATSYRPKIITEENGNIDVEEPFFLGRYDTYTPTIRKTKMDDSVTL